MKQRAAVAHPGLVPESTSKGKSPSKRAKSEGADASSLSAPVPFVPVSDPAPDATLLFDEKALVSARESNNIGETLNADSADIEVIDLDADTGISVRAAAAVSEAVDETFEVLVNGEYRVLSIPSPSARYYISYRWSNNSCALDASGEVIFVTTSSGRLDSFMERFAGTSEPDVDSSSNIVPMSTLLVLMKRRKELYVKKTPPMLLQCLISNTRDMLQKKTLGVSTLSPSTPFTSLWVRCCICMVVADTHLIHRF